MNQILACLNNIETGLQNKSHELKHQILQLNSCVDRLPLHYVEYLQPMLVIRILRHLQISRESTNEEIMSCFLDLFELVFKKSTLKDIRGFFEYYRGILYLLYDHHNLKLRQVSDEFKLKSLKTLQVVIKSLDSSLLLEIYTREHSKKLSILLHMCVNMLQQEKDRQVRLEALKCIMKTAQIDNESVLDEDPVLMHQIATCFVQYLPGIAAMVITVSVDDEKCGFAIVNACIQIWTRLVCVTMQDYGAGDAKPMKNILEIDEGNLEIGKTSEVDEKAEKRNKFDEKLQLCASLLLRLTAHQNPSVRLELAKSLLRVVQKCFLTIPKTISKVIEILIILSADTYENVAEIAAEILDKVSFQLNNGNFREVHEILSLLQHNFYSNLSQIPTIFQGIDSNEQTISLNLLIGYLKLFGEGKLKNMLFTQVNLDRLMVSLINVAELEKSQITILDEYSIEDWTSSENRNATPWKVFKFRDMSLQKKLEEACHLLVQPMALEIVLDYLINAFMHNEEQRMGVTILLNEIMSVQSELIRADKVEDLLSLYLEEEFWNLPLAVDNANCLKEVQKNVIQICLQLEGIGKMALALQEQFRDLLLKVLYPVLEKAGCGHPLLKSSGLQSVSNIAKGCKYVSVTELINRNSDYFSHNVINKLKRQQENESVLNVLSIVVKYSSIDVLPSISDIIEGTLVQSLDLYHDQNSSAYLRVFAVFLKSMHKWYDIQIVVEPIKTKEEKKEETRLKYEQACEELKALSNFSDDIMQGKSAQEMYEADVEKGLFRETNITSEELGEIEEMEESEEYKKEEAPVHIKLVIAILERSLNFLPSKEVERKILVLEILNNGVQILSDYENELLPIVHKIWSPLVNRFKEFEYPLIINLSFQLLSTMAKLAKEFIRRRTLKDVLPSILKVLEDKAKDSYLKDRGSAYRFTQSFKMQVTILENMDRLVYDLDLDLKPLLLMNNSLGLYLSDRQPKPLQEAAVKFFKSVLYFNSDIAQELLTDLSEKYDKEANWRKNLGILNDYEKEKYAKREET